MTAREGDMMGTEYGGKLVGTACVSLTASNKSSVTQSIILPSTSNIDYVIFRQICKPDSMDSVGSYNTIICNTIVLYKNCSVYIPASSVGNTDNIIAAVAQFNTNESILFKSYSNTSGIHQERLNIEMYSFT